MSAELASAVSQREVPMCKAGILLLMWVYRCLGQCACRCLVWVVMLFAYPFLRSARRASASFLQQWRVYTGRRGCSSFRHLLTFSYTIADRLACRMGLFERERVRICTPEAAQELMGCYRRGEGVFCIASHLGCFDMLRVLFAEPAQKGGGEVHVFMDTTATEAFMRMQSRYACCSDLFVHDVHGLGVGMSILMAQKLESGAVVVMAGDRLWREGRRAELQEVFLGRKTAFPRGCFSWAAALCCPVFTFCLAEHCGMYDLHVRCLSRERGGAKTAQLAHEFVHTLEEWCLLYPANWFNFYSYWT